jgi:transcription elongation GreA/GreB family factor
MSRAFVKEQDGDGVEELPELAISEHRNLVTPEGLAQIEANARRLTAELAEARAAFDKSAVARLERDLRYWSSRRASAEVVAPVAEPVVVRFGCTVELRASDGETATFRIVGEDESDPARGLISWVSPLAEALMGAAAGDEVTFRGGPAEIVTVRGNIS